jgi:hypothetical protein
MGRALSRGARFLGIREGRSWMRVRGSLEDREARETRLDVLQPGYHVRVSWTRNNMLG